MTKTKIKRPLSLRERGVRSPPLEGEARERSKCSHALIYLQIE